MNEPTPRNTEQVNHSGKLPGELQETPVTEFNTPLNEAVELTDNEGNPIITTPESVESITNEQADFTETPFTLNPDTLTIDKLQEKKSKKKLFFGIGGVAITALLAFGTVLGIQSADNNKNDVPNNKPVAEAPIDPTAAPSEEAPVTEATTTPEVVNGFDFKVLPESVVQENLFETLSPEQQAEIKNMDAMSVTDFRLLPITEQLKFGYFVYDNNLDALKYRLDNNEGSELYKSANIDTAEGRVANNDMKVALLSSLKTRNDVDGTAYDINTVLKASVILNQTDTYNSKQNNDEFLNGFNTSSVVYTRPIDVVDSALRDNGDFVINTLDPTTNEQYQTTFIDTEVTLINGDVRKDSVVKLSLASNDPRYINDIHN